MKKEVLNTFDELGFKMELIEDLGYSFMYEGINFLYVSNGGDEDFLNISTPGIVELDEENRMDSYQLSEKINSTLKYIKAYKFGSNLWLFYERELFGGEDLKQLISHMILHLEAAVHFTRRLAAPNDKDNLALEEGDNEEPTETE